ncbi:MAG TPA: VOC family protein [Gaiellaceae bacterium]|nr:VOC family protein [Gaiellaceae bacterium]
MQDALHHVGFTVAKMERSIGFYSLLLQAEPVMRRRYGEQFISEVVGYEETLLDCALFSIPRSGVILELLEYLRPVGARADMETYNVGNAHLCLIVDDLEREYRRLREAGVEFRSPPVDVPADIEGDPAKGGRALYLRDPDGITVELLEMPSLAA